METFALTHGDGPGVHRRGPVASRFSLRSVHGDATEAAGRGRCCGRGPSSRPASAREAVSASSGGPFDAFGSYLRSQRKLAQLSLRQLEAITKVSNPYLSQIERGLHQPSIGVIKSLAEALNLSVSDLLSHAAGVEPDEATTTTEAAIRSDPRLDDAQKSALLAVYDSMAREPTAGSDQASSTTSPTRGPASAN
jgi:transcriptional regulator with XRE-family HTH domain